MCELCFVFQEETAKKRLKKTLSDEFLTKIKKKEISFDAIIR